MCVCVLVIVQRSEEEGIPHHTGGPRHHPSAAIQTLNAFRVRIMLSVVLLISKTHALRLNLFLVKYNLCSMWQKNPNHFPRSGNGFTTCR